MSAPRPCKLTTGCVLHLFILVDSPSRRVCHRFGLLVARYPVSRLVTVARGSLCSPAPGIPLTDPPFSLLTPCLCSIHLTVATALSAEAAGQTSEAVAIAKSLDADPAFSSAFFGK